MGFIIHTGILFRMKGGHISNYRRTAVVSEACPKQMGSAVTSLCVLSQFPVVLIIFICVYSFTKLLN